MQQQPPKKEFLDAYRSKTTHEKGGRGSRWHPLRSRNSIILGPSISIIFIFFRERRKQSHENSRRKSRRRPETTSVITAAKCFLPNVYENCADFPGIFLPYSSFIVSTFRPPTDFKGQLSKVAQFSAHLSSQDFDAKSAQISPANVPCHSLKMCNASTEICTSETVKGKQFSTSLSTEELG